MLKSLRQELKSFADANRAVSSARYFKAGKGQYGEGDLFLGITVPQTRSIAKKYQDIDFSDLTLLANSKFHEERLTALHILNIKYSKASNNSERVELFEFWLDLVKRNKVNNWDLIDSSAPYLGEIFSRHLGYGAPFIHGLANSANLWERRAAIMLTFPLIRINKFGPTIAVAKDLIEDEHDLIHKAVGWMLREVGKRDKEKLILFLDKYASVMPRTMLRYSIEKLSQKERKYYLGL